MILDVRKRLYK